MLRLVEVIHYVTDTVELCKRYTKTENTLDPVNSLAAMGKKTKK